MLEILYGPDRSANSAAVLRRICENAARGVEGQILIVPEQYSHETERALCACGGDTISRYAEVLSFTRLAARAFSACGGVCEEYLDENGRILTLYLAAQRVREQLKFYAAVMTRPDFLKQLGTLMEELLTSCIAPDALHQAARRLTGRLAQKVTELALLYESYLSVCKTGRGDPVTRQMRLLDILDETEFLDGRTVFFDGFSDFTALQKRLIGAILAHAADVSVSALTDGSHFAAAQTGGRTAQELCGMARRQGIEVRRQRVEASEERAPAVQAWLEGLFFGGRPSQEDPDGVALIQADSVQAACACAARMVRTGAAEGLRYRDFAIALTDEAAYAQPLQTLLARAGIPVYYAGTRALLQKPPAAALLAAMQASLRYEPGPLFSFLKSDFSPLSAEECDTLEQYAYYWGVRGTRWEEPWQMHPRGLGEQMTPEDERTLAAINDLRARAIAQISDLRRRLRGAAQVGDQVRAVVSFLEDTAFAERLYAQQERLHTQQEAQRAQEYGQLGDALIETLEQLDRVLHDAALEPESFVQLFSMLLANGKVGTIPAVCDAVLVTTLPMLRHRSSHTLLVLGADEGLLPSFTEPGGLLADVERQKLRALGVELAPGGETAMEREMSWICAAFCAARERAVLVTAAQQPSFLYTRTAALFPAMQAARAETLPFFPDCAAAACAALHQPVLPQELPPAVRAEAQTLRVRSEYRPADMSGGAVRALYGQTLQLSASKIDRFAACRYAYFLQYGLRAKPWKQASFDAPLFGTFVHYVLEHTVRDAQQQGGFARLSDEQTLALAGRHMDAYLQTYLPQLTMQGSREVYLSARNRQEAAAVVLDVARELRMSQFQPVAEELRFADGGALPPITYRAKAGTGRLTGVVDRVDVYEYGGVTYFRIIDYKTGRKDFDFTELLYGGNLQMLLYMFALQNGADTRRMQPAGTLYVPGRFDMVKLDPGEDTEKAGQLRANQLRRKGLVLRDEAILQAMEPAADAPQYLPGEDGRVSAGQMRQLEDYVNKKVTGMVDAIFSGAVAPDPVERGPDVSACTYCDYASVCHKDAGAVAPRRMRAVKPEEFWAELERSGAHG